MTDLVVLGRVGMERVAFDAAVIEAALDLHEIVPVPLAPPHIRGIAAVRSQVLTVVDVGLAVGQGSACEGRRVLVVQSEGHRYALLVDAVDEVVTPEAVHAGIDASLGAGWNRVATSTIEAGGQYHLLLDVPALIAGPTACRVAA